MSCFCSLDGGNIDGIFTLTMSSSSIDGHKYLTQDTIAELIKLLTAVRDNGAVKGLVTTCEAGSFCDGVDYTQGGSNPPEAEKQLGLGLGLGKVVKLLLELPVPTVAAVGGNATSLGLALALAHDHLVVWDHAVLSLPEAKLGRPLPGYVAALLRDKGTYTRLSKLLMFGSQPCKGSDLPCNPWWLAHSGSDDTKVVLENAVELLYNVVEAEIGKTGANYAVARQTLFPETCAAVGIALFKCPRPSREQLKLAAPTYSRGGKEKHGPAASAGSSGCQPSKPWPEPAKKKVIRKPA